jgi:hypothetical protein
MKKYAQILMVLAGVLFAFTGVAWSTQAPSMTGASGKVTCTVTSTNVSGMAASGAAAAGNPILVAGKNGSNAQTLLTDTHGSLNTTTDGPSNKATYMVAGSALTAYSTANDILYVQGSATKTVRIKQIRVTLNAATAGAYYLQLTRHGAIGTGNKAADTPNPLDSRNVTAATAVVEHYTAASGAPTNPLVLGSQRAYLATTNGSVATLTWDFSKPNSQPLILSGATDFMGLSLAGQTVTSNGTYDYEIIFEEDAS